MIMRCRLKQIINLLSKHSGHGFISSQSIQKWQEAGLRATILSQIEITLHIMSMLRKILLKNTFTLPTNQICSQTIYPERLWCIYFHNSDVVSRHLLFNLLILYLKWLWSVMFGKTILEERTFMIMFIFWGGEVVFCPSIIKCFLPGKNQQHLWILIFVLKNISISFKFLEIYVVRISPFPHHM